MAINREKSTAINNEALQYSRLNQHDTSQSVFDAVYHSIKEFIEESEQDALTINGKIEALYYSIEFKTKSWLCVINKLSLINSQSLGNIPIFLAYFFFLEMTKGLVDIVINQSYLFRQMRGCLIRCIVYDNE